MANDENFPLYMQEIKQVYEQKNKIAIIFDATEAVFPALKYQKMQGTWLKENEALMQQYCLGTAYVIPKTIIRTVLKTIFTFQKQPVPFTVCKTLEEAQIWVDNQIKTN